MSRMRHASFIEAQNEQHKDNQDGGLFEQASLPFVARLWRDYGLNTSGTSEPLYARIIGGGDGCPSRLCIRHTPSQQLW
jgi:hypothetical protein